MFIVRQNCEDLYLHATSIRGGAYLLTLIDHNHLGALGIPTVRSTTHPDVDLSTLAALQATMLLGDDAPASMWELCEQFYADNPAAVRVIP